MIAEAESAKSNPLTSKAPPVPAADQAAQTAAVNALLGIAAGRVTSLLLQLAIDLDVFAKLTPGPVPLADAAALWGLPGPSARLVAQYLCSAGLLIYRDGALANAPLAAALLAQDSERRRDLTRLFRYDLTFDELKGQLLDPPALHWYQLRDHGRITDMRPLLRQEREDWVAELARKRHANRIQWGQDLAAIYDFSAHRVLIDMGGASGGYCVGIRKRNPHLRCMVLDLEEATAVAREKIAEEGEAEAVQVVTGSILETLPPGADVALMANVFHLWAIEDCRAILGRVREMLPPGGAVLVRELYLEDDWRGSIEPVFEAFLLLGKEGQSGWQPSYSEVEALLREAGFVDVERRRQLVLGRKARG